MNCVSCDICVHHLGLFVFIPGVFLGSRVTGACSVTTDLIMCVNVRTTTSITTCLWGLFFSFYSLRYSTINLRHQPLVMVLDI